MIPPLSTSEGFLGGVPCAQGWGAREEARRPAASHLPNRYVTTLLPRMTNTTSVRPIRAFSARGSDRSKVARRPPGKRQNRERAELGHCIRALARSVRHSKKVSTADHETCSLVSWAQAQNTDADSKIHLHKPPPVAFSQHTSAAFTIRCNSSPSVTVTTRQCPSQHSATGAASDWS